MKNGIDFRKIGGGEYGAINLNNMIPVPESALVLMDIDKEPDLKYRALLKKQFIHVDRDREGIEKTAKNLRRLLLKDISLMNEHERDIRKRSCNLKLLEEVYMDYKG